MAQASCLFCQIVAGDVPSDTVYEDPLVLAFNDIAPVAPVHQLIIPRRHIESAVALAESDGELLGRLFTVASRLAAESGLTEAGFRVVTNVGPDGGQTVSHLHFHLIGGRRMTWPPG